MKNNKNIAFFFRRKYLKPPKIEVMGIFPILKKRKREGKGKLYFIVYITINIIITFLDQPDENYLSFRFTTRLK